MVTLPASISRTNSSRTSRRINCVDDTPSAYAASSIPYTNLASSSFSIILCLLSPQL